MVRSIPLFMVDDKSHPLAEKIKAELMKLYAEMKEAGYIADTRWVLHNIGEEEKEHHRLCFHSEKMALMYGLMCTPAGTTLQIVKNLRMYGDCHAATKFIAKLKHRSIIVRDANRFHHFRDGKCSCNDYF